MASTSHPHDALVLLLKEVRKERKINQEELSTRLGKHRVYVTKYESGDRRLDLFELMEICRELSLDIHAVINAIEANTPKLQLEQEAYLHGLAKGFLVAKGYKLVRGLFTDDDK